MATPEELQDLVAQILAQLGTDNKEDAIEMLKDTVRGSDGETKTKFQAFLTILQEDE